MNKTLLRALSCTVILCNVHAADDNPRKLDDTFLQQRLKNRKIYERKREILKKLAPWDKDKVMKAFLGIEIVSAMALVVGKSLQLISKEFIADLGTPQNFFCIVMLISTGYDMAINSEKSYWQRCIKLNREELLALRCTLDNIDIIRNSQKKLVDKSIFTLVDRYPIMVEDTLKDKQLLSKILPEALHSVVQEAVALKKKYPDEWAQFITNR